jgi:hypothetical protein
MCMAIVNAYNIVVVLCLVVTRTERAVLSSLSRSGIVLLHLRYKSKGKNGDIIQNKTVIITLQNKLLIHL